MRRRDVLKLAAVPFVAQLAGGVLFADEEPEEAGDDLEAAAALVPDVLPDTGQPYTPGLRDGEVILRDQAWWTPLSNDSGGHGHLHIDLVFPHNQVASGTLLVPFRVVLHDNPGIHNVLRVDAAPGKTIWKKTYKPPIQGPAQGTLSYSGVIDIDTRLMKNGDNTLRFRAQTKTPDGKAFTTTTEYPVVVQNAPSNVTPFNTYAHGACPMTGTMPKAYYGGPGYGMLILDPVPHGPVSSDFVVSYRARDGSVRITAFIDKSHEIPATGDWAAVLPSPGIQVLDTTTNLEKWQKLLVDIDQLADGIHWLDFHNFTGKGAVSADTGPEKNFLSARGGFYFEVKRA